MLRYLFFIFISLPLFATSNQTCVAAIVREAPHIGRQLDALHSAVSKLIVEQTVDGVKLGAFRLALTALEYNVRHTEWVPPGGIEDTSRIRQLAVRDASHDLKNILQRCRIIAEQMREGTLTFDERMLVLKSLEANLRESKELLEIIKNPINSPRVLLNLRRFMRDAEEIFSIPGSKYEIIIDAPKEDIVIRASRTGLLRILDNLVTNSMQAMPDGGKIKIVAKRSDPSDKIDISFPKAGVYLAVQDNGPGIPEETRRAMEVHNVSSVKDKDGVNPRGIGLASLFDIAGLNNAELLIVPNLAKGTDIRVYFQEIPKRELNDGLRQEIAQPASPGMVLFVDDDMTNIRMLPRILKGTTGIPAVAVSESLSLVEYVKLHGPLIRAFVLDQKLADGSDPEETVAELRAMGITAPIFTSSSMAEADCCKNADGYLPKPFDYRHFEVALRAFEAARSKPEAKP